ncbi:granulin a isoform X3 [Neoarius graeffei]|uniref:granulin a isoform X3 n=1 Tax=Neoarius graeffei TaxID=443677 RepID=UPI00298CBC11|nr:granulin a isoform X3 [Neoarius graeffei]
MLDQVRSSPGLKTTHLRMLRLTAGVLLLSLVAGSKCPDEQCCGDKQTCCQIHSGEFNCCPLHQGECCEDHLHCCPKGMLCEVKESRCTNTTHSLPWAERFPSEHSGLVKSFRMVSSSAANNMYDTICPDNSFCPSEFSCLKVSSMYGCCPVAQGIVCSDGKHCCLSGQECTANSTSCVKKTVSDVPCDDTKSCPDGSTCCKDEQGEWSCCPLPQAVCCEDFIHCCPHGKKCNLAAQSCDDPSGSVPWLKKEPSRPLSGQKVPKTEVSDVPCDDTKSCPDGSTCCKDEEGEWSCCPLPQAVCCEDFIHCCPHGKKCNLAAQSCDDPSGSVPWLKKEPSRPLGGQKVPKTEGTSSNISNISLLNCRKEASVFLTNEKKIILLCSVSDVPCDDTKSCPDGSTCCKDEQGGWGCCPLPQAVCCEDFIHCCPHGKKCNLTAQSCDDPSGSVPWLKKEPSRPLGGQKVPKTKVSDVPCDDTKSCPDGCTCCKDEQGGWSCCPLPQAVCCEDFIHCCPHGKKCNLAAQSCDDPSGSVPWLKKEPSRPLGGQKVPKTEVSDVPCDDTKSCPDGCTCCKDEQGGWSCCPLPQAVCCEDFIHCCPHGKKCNLAAQSCDDPSGSVPWLKKEPSRPISGQKVPKTEVSDVPCDDTKSCPDGSTCCKDEQGGWGCCPLSQAVCCEDFIHCCPHGKKCNLAAQSCDDPSGSVPWLKKEPSRPLSGQKVPKTEVSDVPCDDTKSCPDGSTCCKDEQGGWGCCPLPQAVCCEDFIHCCPHGKKCNLAAQSCDDPSGSVPWLKKEPSRPISGQKVPKTEVSDVPCDDTKSCPDGSTCCKDEQGGWGCCPLPQAVCCEDFIHCCPHGKKCNLAAQSCDDPSGSVPWLKKEPSRPLSGQKVPKTKVSDVPCDDTKSCPDGSTCCKDEQGGWGCCPLPQAVCCEDFIHCCPHGKKCNLAAQSCDDPSGSVPWLKKEPSRPISGQKVPKTDVSDVPCDDTKSCPDGSTCCKNEQGGWGCCPLSQAVCCEDFIHCCPHGKKCNLAAQSCDDPSGSVPWLKKEPSRPISGQKVPKTEVSDVPCDDTKSCPDGSTCCKDEQGGWGCCPLSQAVCCEDFIHCCPHGKKCNLTAQSCDDPSGSVPWLKKEPSRPLSGQKVPKTEVSDVPCDDTKSCPDGSTCCKDEQGGWSCCPLPQAVCCEDFIHCCPHGKKCNLAAQSCDDPSGSVPWLKKEPSRPISVQKVPKTEVSDVPCDDTKSCPDGSTCCKDEQGGWGCCPLPQAVCCEDFIHCCPHGKKCNLAAQSCDDPSGSVPWLKKEPSQPIGGQKVPKTEVSDVLCDDTKSCPDGSTCCKDEQGGWSCCPLSQAVCCEDFIHCCPHGTKCNLTAQSCDDLSGSVPWLKKEPSRPTAPTAQNTSVNRIEVKCDHYTSCPEYTTCCFMHKNQKWGCCPLDQATCCADGENCCPKGYFCRDQWCEKSSWINSNSVSLASVRDTIMSQIHTINCGGGISCSDLETCCRTSVTAWACCPFPKAVCCSDMQHCCPMGYTCAQSGYCTRAMGFSWDMFFSKKKRALTTA